MWNNSKHRSVKRGMLGNRVSQDKNKLCKKRKLSAWLSHGWPTQCRLRKWRRTKKLQMLCLFKMPTLAQNTAKQPFPQKVLRGETKPGQFWGRPDESVRNNACHHACVNSRVRLGGKQRHPRHRAMMTPPQICISEDSSKPQAGLKRRD